jgi:hypothetical protein
MSVPTFFENQASTSAKIRHFALLNCGGRGNMG